METVVEAGPAEVYDRAFVPALFAQWGPVVAAAAGFAAGARVLDVGCGTGAATVAAAARAGRDGRVVGLDPNPEMLTVARRKPGIEWVEGRAEELPFRNAEFDAVISQFAMMFFDDRVVALREMQRVLAPGGRMAVAVCGALTASPGYTPDGSRAIILRPNKRRRRIVNMPLTPAEAIIDKAPLARRLILKPARAEAWDPARLSREVREYATDVEIRRELRFNDLRGTKVTEMVWSGISVPDLAIRIGWKIETAAKMLGVYAALNPGRASVVALPAAARQDDAT